MENKKLDNWRKNYLKILAISRIFNLTLIVSFLFLLKFLMKNFSYVAKKKIEKKKKNLWNTYEIGCLEDTDIFCIDESLQCSGVRPISDKNFMSGK